MSGLASAVRDDRHRKGTRMANTITYEHTGGALDGVAGFFDRVRKAWADHRLYRATLDELNELNDRELADLGLTRFMIREVAHESVYGA